MKPLLTTKDIVKRIVAFALAEVGFSEVNANVVAEVHCEHSDPRLDYWSGWLTTNCLSCKHQPESCNFFSPDASEDVAKEDVKESHLRLVEMNWDPCPFKESPE